MNNPQDFWRDPIWQSVGVVVAILFGITTLILAVISVRLARRRKSLTYEVISLTPLATLHDDMEGRVQITLDGEPVRDVQLALVKFTNSGNIPIESSEYEQPVKMSLNDKARILSAGITETHPKSIKASIETDQTNLMLMPLLLNSEDSITVKILAADFDGSISIEGRIAGVSDIKELKLKDIQVGRLMLMIGSTALIISACVFLVLFILGMNINKTIFYVIWLYSGGVVLLGILGIFNPDFLKALLRALAAGRGFP